MPVIEIRTVKKYEESKKISVLRDIDKNLLNNLSLKESRFLINWGTFDSNSFLHKGIEPGEVKEEYPIIHIHSMEGKSEQVERTIIDTIIKTLSEGINMDYKNITVIYHRISSGNIYSNGNYLQV